MKWIAPLLLIWSLVMVCLTDPQGFAVWIERQQVVSVTHPIDCTKDAHAKIATGNGTFFCVQETVKDALTKLEGSR